MVPDRRRLVFTAVNAEIPRHVVAVLFESRFEVPLTAEIAYPQFSVAGDLFFTSTRIRGRAGVTC